MLIHLRTRTRRGRNSDQSHDRRPSRRCNARSDEPLRSKQKRGPCILRMIDDTRLLSGISAAVTQTGSIIRRGPTFQAELRVDPHHRHRMMSSQDYSIDGTPQAAKGNASFEAEWDNPNASPRTLGCCALNEMVSVWLGRKKNESETELTPWYQIDVWMEMNPLITVLGIVDHHLSLQ